jgi:hypothetical protein
MAQSQDICLADAVRKKFDQKSTEIGYEGPVDPETGEPLDYDDSDMEDFLI